MKTINLFIIHSWKHQKDYENLISLLSKRAYFEFRNSSIPRNKKIIGLDKDVWEKIERNIQWASIVIFIGGIYASHSEAMQDEIAIANKYHKPILTIKPIGNERVSTFSEFTDEIVSWNIESIVKKIRELIS